MAGNAPVDDPKDWVTVTPSATSASTSANDPGDWQTISGAPSTSASHTPDTLLDKAGHLAEDVFYPTIGGMVGTALTSETGPGMLLGGAAGAVEGNELKREMRHLRGRDDLNPQGLAHVTDDALAAGGGAMQGYGDAAKAAQAARSLPETGSVPGRILSWVQNHLRTNPSTSGMMSNILDAPTNRIVLNSGHQLADEIASASLGSDPNMLGNTISHAAKSVQQNAGQLYDNALKQITAQGADQIPVKLTLPDGIQDTANRMLSELQGNRGDFKDVFKDAQDRNLAIHTLQQFAEVNQPAKVSSIVDASGKPITTPGGPKVLPWNGARTLASDLDAVIRSGDQTIGKGGLSQLKQALQQSMQSSLDGASPGLGTKFRNASTNYAQVQDSMNQTIIQRLLENNSPELAAKYLLQGGNTLAKVDALQKAIGTQGQNVLSGSVLKEMLTGATDHTNSTLAPSKLLSKWNSMTPQVKQMLFPDPKHFDSVNKFMQNVDQHVLPVKSMTGAQMAQGGNIAVPLVSKIPVAGRFVPSIHIDPEYASQLLSRADTADKLAKLVSSKAGTAEQRQATATLVQMMHATQNNNADNQ